MAVLLVVTGILFISGLYCVSQRWHKEALLVAVPLAVCLALLLPHIAGGQQ